MFYLQNVKYAVDGQDILTLDTLKLEKAKTILLHGPSGCGKTTLLQIMAGIRKAQTGSVEFDSIDLRTLKGKRLDQFRGRNFGFVFQNFHLLRHLSVSDNIRLSAAGARIPANKEKIIALLDHFGLSDKRDQKAASLSHGEAQRVAIARAVAHSPQVIFADEPTSALDDNNTDKVMDLLEEQARETGAMLIVATHDSRIKDRFDKILRMKDGGVIS